MYESQVNDNKGSTSTATGAAAAAGTDKTKSDSESDWQRARIGIQLLLNNRIAEAEALFGSRKDNVQMAAGYCFVTFMNALMTFEDDKLQESLQTLRDMEKRCVQDIGWLKAVRNRVFGQEQLSAEQIASKLEEQIILADSQVCVALLTFLQHDLSGYVRGGWVLRKAWKVYQHTYGQILQIYQRACGSEHVPGSDFPAWQVVMKRDMSHGSFTGSLSGSEWSVPCSSNPSPASPLTPNGTTPNGGLRGAFSSFLGSNEHQSPILEPDMAARLMCAVSFGYGIFQLCISLLPPSLLKLIHFLGFEGDRHLGVSALMFSRQGHDMRAPLATLALLWYHTIVRPFFALDGSNVRAGVDSAQQLLDESHSEFGQSALFLFFKGRVERLRSNIEAALEAYEAAVLASPQREVQLLCLHEVGWCHLIRLDWSQAYSCFIQLKVRSRWSNTFYTYLAAVCCGAQGDLDSAKRLCFEIKPANSTNASTSNGAGSQLEYFIRRRTPAFLDNKIDRDGCRLLVFEMLYLWNALPSCSQEHIESMQEECIQGNSEPLIGLRNLLNGAASICLGKTDSACHYFRSCLEQRHLSYENPSITNLNDHHISAFALYELGVMLTKESQTLEEGIKLLSEAQTQPKGYDFENRLNVRIHAALRNAQQHR